MKKTVTITLLTIDELDTQAKNKALAEHKEFLIDTYNDDMYDESYSMTRSKYANSLTQGEVLESIEINEYLFFPNGEMASVTHFTGKHPRSGETECAIKGMTYPVADCA